MSAQAVHGGGELNSPGQGRTLGLGLRRTLDRQADTRIAILNAYGS